MNGICEATTKAGQRCRAVALTSGLCALHADPSLAAKMGRKSGQARRSKAAEYQEAELAPPRTAHDVRTALGLFMSDARAGRLDPKVASTLGYLANVLLKSMEVADLEERLTILESVVGTEVPKSKRRELK